MGHREHREILPLMRIGEREALLLWTLRALTSTEMYAGEEVEGNA